MESTKTTEELLKENKKWSYVRTDRNGTRYFSDPTCPRCGGRGGMEAWPGYTCYECGGSGVSHRATIIKIYTPEHAAKLAAQREARAQKQEKERFEAAIAQRGANLIKAGFGKEGETYVIYRAVGNTFPIKDKLKALGCKYNPIVGWFAPKPLDGYEMQRLEEAQVLRENAFVEWKPKAEVEELFLENIRKVEESPSTHYGEIGEVVELDLHIDRVFESEFRRNDGWFGTTVRYMYLMHDAAGNIFKWSTSCCYDEGADVRFKATIKDHTEYKGVAQTVLTRCTRMKG